MYIMSGAIKDDVNDYILRLRNDNLKIFIIKIVKKLINFFNLTFLLS